jgi:hypothetical protein
MNKRFKKTRETEQTLKRKGKLTKRFKETRKTEQTLQRNKEN